MFKQKWEQVKIWKEVVVNSEWRDSNWVCPKCKSGVLLLPQPAACDVFRHSSYFTLLPSE